VRIISRGGMTDMVEQTDASCWRRRARGVVEGLVVVGVFCVTPGVWRPVQAETVCVTCVAPERRYRCEVQADGGESALRAAPVACAAKIAQDNKHDSCAVTQSVKNCDGVLKIYRLSELTQNADVLAPAPAGGSAAAAASDDVDAKADEPATVADMTKGSLEKSGENMRKAKEAISNAGEAVGNAAKRTLKCLGGGDC
jgi:hypothetical protein